MSLTHFRKILTRIKLDYKLLLVRNICYGDSYIFLALTMRKFYYFVFDAILRHNSKTFSRFFLSEDVQS